MILLYIAMALAGVILVMNLSRQHHYKSVYGMKAKELSNFSWPATDILKRYKQLPEASRPEGDIRHILRALDTKHKIDEVNDHFSESTYDGRRKTWKCDCTRGYRYIVHECPFNDYHYIKKGIDAIAAALEEQRHAFEIAGVETDLIIAEEFTKRLQDEAKTVESVTKGVLENERL